jgi:hypothetical protein
MSESYEIAWLGYNSKSNYNRVWGLVKKVSNGDHFAFWGTKNGKLDFKQQPHIHRLTSLIRQQEQKGFKKIDPEHFEMIRPNFQTDFEIWFTTALLSDSYK